MFYGKFTDEGDNTVNNPKIYDVEGNNRLSPDLQPVFVFSILKIILLFSAKQNIKVINIL